MKRHRSCVGEKSIGTSGCATRSCEGSVRGGLERAGMDGLLVGMEQRPRVPYLRVGGSCREPWWDLELDGIERPSTEVLGTALTTTM